jgi:hypothetical protein
MTNPKNSTSAPDRRAFLSASVAAGSALLIGTTPMTGPAIASHGAPDPIFAAIEAHKAARAIVYAAVDAVSAAEKDLRGQGLRAYQERGKCPSLDKCEATLMEAFDAETDAACVLVSESPTTIAGVLALLAYANAADIDGEGWPSGLCDDDANGKTRSWHYFLIESLTKVLPGLVQA